MKRGPRPTIEAQAETATAPKGKVSPLHHYRRLKEWTLAEAAGLVGVTESAMSLYESGHRSPPPEMKIKLARIYDVPVEALFPPDLS